MTSVEFGRKDGDGVDVIEGVMLEVAVRLGLEDEDGVVLCLISAEASTM